MARLVKCPIVFSVGFIDTVCPPTSVYSAYNNIPGKDKSILHGIYAAHGGSLVAGDNSAFGACNSILYREKVSGRELLVNGDFRYQLPVKNPKGKFLPFAWHVKGANATVRKDGEKAFLSIGKESRVQQTVYNLRKKKGTITVKGKFRGKGVSYLHLEGAITPVRRLLKAASPEKWQDFSYTYNVKDGSYACTAVFIAGKEALLEVTDVSCEYNK